MRLAPKNFQRAFTLLEIMVAIGLFMLLIGIIYSTWTLVMKATVTGQKAAADSQRERVAVRTIEEALLCAQSFQASPKYYSFVVENGDAATLSFAARLPDVFPRNGKFGDFNLRRVTFQLEPGKDGLKNLVLRQNPILMDMDDDEKKFPIVLARNVKTLLMECWDAQQLDWVTEWKNTNSIPAFIRVGLVLAAKPESHAPDLVVTRAVAVPSQMMPVAIQRGGALGPGGGGGGGQTNARTILNN